MAPRVVVTKHPGSSRQEIDNEPTWGFGHNHRIGYTNADDRQPGFTNAGDWQDSDEEEEVEEYNENVDAIRKRVKKGELINFRDIMQSKTDFHLERPENHPPGWRFMVDVTEDWVKTEQHWPANEKAKQKKKEAEAKKNEDRANGEKDGQQEKSNLQTPDRCQTGDEAQSDDKQQSSQTGTRPEQGGNPQKGTEHEDHWGGDEQDDEENQWKRKQGDNETHHAAYARNAVEDEGYHSENSPKGDDDSAKDRKSDWENLRQKYSPEEIALLRVLRHEKDYIAHLGQNDGKGTSPTLHKPDLIDIDVADQFSPDNWIPRSGNLIRLTGKHPLNGEPELSKLFEAGTITPNELHYVRNHGAVPRLRWETHKLDVENGSLVLSMDELKKRFDSINIPVALACDGNRRGELNLIRKSKGFSWGSGAISCAYWKGAPLRDILLEAGVDAGLSQTKKRYVNFEGAENLTDGKYATSIPLEYALDPANDVLITYEMNNVPLPPDHGFPCRLMIPGFVGGRCVKWLSRIWTSDKENDSHYHIWDNRVLPSFVTEKDGEFATAMFKHPSTACYEQNLNSIITKPAQSERLVFADANKKQTYRVQGLAYDGGGHEVQRVELSLDGGLKWLYCIRKFPDNPIRHGNKFWTWLHWHIDVDMGHMLEAKSLIVRCFNVFKNTQPQEPSWNTMGMMNNGWYTVLPSLETCKEQKASEAALIFRHPFDPKENRGWMKPSLEVQLQAAKADSGVPDKEFTRQEIEKHSSNSDCWIVINDKVYDATSVLSWHPGGAASILGYAGKLTAETTSSFESIHDGYATKKLNECIIGKVTKKAANFIKEQAKAAAEEAAKSAAQDKDILLQKQRWTPVEMVNRKSISDDTRSYTFKLPPGKTRVGLDTCQHIQFGIHTKDKMLIRSYTPTRPVLSSEEDGTFELVVKTYLPTTDQPGGAFSNFLDCLPIGESVEVRGPTGEIRYLGNGSFEIEGKQKQFPKISLILGGSGITPGYQLIERILRTSGDSSQLRVIDANKSENDILLRESLNFLAKQHPRQFKITHVLSHPSDKWEGTRGHINEEIIKKSCFAPDEQGAAVFLCGPPSMIQKGAIPVLKAWGYKEEENCFGF